MIFDNIDTLDREAADKGVWKDVKRGEKTLMSGLVRYVDPLEQSGELLYKRARAPFSKLIKAKALDDMDLAIIALCYVNLIDWKGVTSEGKPVPFEPKIAHEFFKQNRWMALQLISEANNTDNFARDAEFDADDIEGN